MQPAPAITNAFTVDVEDYYHVSGFADHVRCEHWDQYESRVVANTQRVLQLLAAEGVRGTFFVLGWVAERFPQIVRDIHAAGHELACHSFWHRLVYRMTPDEFREDLRRARGTIEDIAGTAVTAYRAPSFSITEKSLWALDILIEEGFLYDSSIFPIHHDRYGMPNAERFPHRIEREAGSLVEFPPSVYRMVRLNAPVGGGGYFRLYPVWLSQQWLGQINRRHHQPFMFYIHPWEFDPDQPRLPGSRRSRFRHYLNLAKTERRTRHLLQRFRFGTMTEALASLDEGPQARVVGANA